jgi:membrane fusion protein, multidrug efflux system
VSTTTPESTPAVTPPAATPPVAPGAGTLPTQPSTATSIGAIFASLVSRRPLFAGGVALAALAFLYICYWLFYRFTHSITDDAFVEAHIVNVAPQSVSGHLVRFLVDENDRVEQGQVISEIDPITYQDQVDVARSKVDVAEAELRRQEADLARLRLEVPIQIEIARRSFAAAKADEAKAQQALKLTEDDVKHGIEEGQAGVDAASADLVLAQQEFTRFTNLQKDEAVPLRRAQEVTQARDSAEARRKLAATKLAQARANQTQIEVAKRTLEAAQKTSEKAAKGVDLAETGDAEIRMVELLTMVKKQNVAEARSALTSAENLLKYTQIRAPFSGVIVKSYRHRGDFASAGIPIVSMYNPNLLYVTANLEETRLDGVAPGNIVQLHIDAFAHPFAGRVVWINKSTGAEFSLMPRNVVSGEFTKVVQRVPVRIIIEKDDRWPLLRAGLSVQAEIKHGQGDAKWAEQAAREMAEIDMRGNKLQPSPRMADASDER